MYMHTHLIVLSFLFANYIIQAYFLIICHLLSERFIFTLFMALHNWNCNSFVYLWSILSFIYLLDSNYGSVSSALLTFCLCLMFALVGNNAVSKVPFAVLSRFSDLIWFPAKPPLTAKHLGRIRLRPVCWELNIYWLGERQPWGMLLNCIIIFIQAFVRG